MRCRGGVLIVPAHALGAAGGGVHCALHAPHKRDDCRSRRRRDGVGRVDVPLDAQARNVGEVDGEVEKDAKNDGAGGGGEVHEVAAEVGGGGGGGGEVREGAAAASRAAGSEAIYRVKIQGACGVLM